MESPKVQFNKNSEERRKRRTKFLFVALLLLVIIIVGLIGFLRKDSFQVTGVEVSGTHALSPRDIIQKAKENFSGNYA
jgi:cell division septal protein FtsQ